ncbi:MAG: Crp/Fnr family transcriptional regulator [Alphaproteobacteria bacterium]|nr:MAG: Crp/Fnr family transcriptional regulator [Alphaproteobacteria bacterium]
MSGTGDARGTQARSLAGVTLFAGLDEADRRHIEARCLWRRYRAGETILERGSDSREVLFIVFGAVNVVNYSASGREIAYATLRAGDCFGELAAIDGLPRSASVVAVEPTLVAALPSERFIDLLKENVAVTFRVLERLTAMVRSGDARIMELSTLAATHRVYAELLRMARPDPAGTGLWVIHPLPPLREVASRVSTTRETVARALGQLYPDGLIRRKGRSLYIMDRPRFEAMLADLQGSPGL